MHPYTTNWFLTGKAPQRTGNAHSNLCPYSQFQTGTKPIFLGVGNDRQFQRFCAEITRPDLAQDKRFRTNADRVVNRDALHEIIEAALAELDGDAVCTALLDRGVPCGVVQDVPDVLTHPHTAHRGMIRTMGDYRGIFNAIRMSRTPATLRRTPPALRRGQSRGAGRGRLQRRPRSTRSSPKAPCSRTCAARPRIDGPA